MPEENFDEQIASKSYYKRIGKKYEFFLDEKKINISSLCCSSSKHTNQLIVIA
jgi:hypothetical protein